MANVNERNPFSTFKWTNTFLSQNVKCGFFLHPVNYILENDVI